VRRYRSTFHFMDNWEWPCSFGRGKCSDQVKLSMPVVRAARSGPLSPRFAEGGPARHPMASPSPLPDYPRSGHDACRGDRSRTARIFPANRPAQFGFYRILTDLPFARYAYPGSGRQQAVEGNVNYNCPITRAARVPGGAERGDLAGLVVTVPCLITAGALPGVFPDANRRLSRNSLCTGQEAIGAHSLQSYNACQIRPNHRKDAIGRHGSRPARSRALVSKNRCRRRCSHCPNSVGGNACSSREC
jgi:hypothetical protein